jgi:hypothetical protein
VYVKKSKSSAHPTLVQADLPRAFHQPPNNAKEAYQILMMKVLISKG